MIRPKSSKIASIGNNHQRLRRQRKPNNSPTTWRLEAMLRKNFFIPRLSLPDDKPIHIECVDIALPKGIEGVGWCVHDGFAAQVEAGIE